MTTISEAALDLLNAPNVGVLTTLGPRGEPQTTALWYLFDGDQICLSLNTARQKTRNIQRDPRVSFFLLDPTNPYRTIEVRGTATVEPDNEYAFANRVGEHYGGANLRDNDRPGESRVIVRIPIEKVNTFGM